jgi:ATP-dependent Clp protease adaptor protein ClpS
MPETKAPRHDVDIGVRQELFPPWTVVLHNDDYNTMSYVVTCLLNTVRDLSEQRATEIMYEAHTHGKARVVTCPLEVAEFYRDRLESLVLTATIEKE